MHSHADDDTHEVTIEAGGCRFEFEMRGKIVFRDDETGIASMARNALFSVDDRRPGSHRTLRIEGSRSGEPTILWTVDGETRPMDAEGQAWLAETIVSFFRSSGSHAEERIDRFLARGGVDAVFEEMQYLPGDYVRARYFRGLLKATHLDDGQVLRWVQFAGSSIASDYELASTLRELPEDRLDRPDVQNAFVEAASSIESDYEMRRTLTPLVEKPAVSPQALEVLVRLAAEIESDYELAALLIALADHHSRTSPLPDAFFQTARTIQSDYELGRTLMTLIKHPMPVGTLTSVLETALSIESDYTLGSVLEEIAQRHDIDNGARQAFDRALDSIGSPYERQKVERAVGS